MRNCLPPKIATTVQQPFMFHYRNRPSDPVHNRARMDRFRARQKGFKGNEIALKDRRAAQRSFMFHYRAELLFGCQPREKKR